MSESDGRETAKQRFVDDYLAYLLAQASHLVSAEFHARVEARGLSVAYWRVLATLSDADGMTMGELTRIVLYKQPTLSKIIDRMEGEGLIERRASADDRRKVRVHITEAGRALVAELQAEAKRHEADVLTGYGPEEKALLKKVLRQVISHCEERA